MLEQDENFLKPLVEERNALKYRIHELTEEIKQVDSELTRQQRRQNEFENRLEGMGNDADNSFVGKFFDENVRPLIVLLKEKRKTLQQAEEDGSVAMSEQTEDEIRHDLNAAIIDEEQLTDAKRYEVINTFVESVEVLIPEQGGECIIYFNWSEVILNALGHRLTDTLIASQSLVKDKRPFTEEEDSILRDVFPIKPNLTYVDIKDRLLPGRKIDAIVRRVSFLGIPRPAISKKWIAECRLLDQTWSQKNPDALYLCIRDTRLNPCDFDTLIEINSQGETVRDFWAEVAVIGKGMIREYNAPLNIWKELHIHEKHWKELHIREKDWSS